VLANHAADKGAAGAGRRQRESRQVHIGRDVQGTLAAIDGDGPATEGDLARR